MSNTFGGLPLPASILSNKGGGDGRYLTNSNGIILMRACAYITISIFVTFINKLLFTYSEYKFPYPFFTVLFQLVFSLICMVLWSLFMPYRFSHIRIPPLMWDSTVAIRVAPLTIVYMCIIIYNPLFVQHVESTAYQFAHSLSVAFSILFSYLILRTKTSQRVNSACIIAIFGTSVGSMGYLNFSWIGAFYCVAWPAVVALYGIYLKKTLIAMQNDIWSVVQYNTIMSIAIMVPLVILSGEFKTILKTVWFLDEFGFWLQLAITGLTGLSINVAMLVLLMHTSPITVAMASISKGAIQPLVAVMIFGNPITLLNVSGILITLAGSCFYAYTRSKESRR